MGFQTHWHFGKTTIFLELPMRMSQGDCFELDMDDTYKNTFQIDGESFKHEGGKATVRIHHDTQVKVLRYGE